MKSTSQFLCGLAAALVVLVIAACSDSGMGERVLAARPEGGDFVLQSAAGPLDTKALRGNVLLVYFGYLNCPDVCPISMAAGAQALSFAAASDVGTPSLARGAHVTAYFDMPRVIIASQQKAKDAPVAEAVLDLARNRIRAVPYPGQTIEGGMVLM